MTSQARHLYVHLPFCAHRCGYCDFVTLVGRRERHGSYVDAVLREIALEQRSLADTVETVFLGGGTPTFTEPAALAQLLDALPVAQEVTIEANPETVTVELARMLRECGVSRISLGVQSFQPHLLDVLDRVAGPAAARAAFGRLRETGFDNISLDLVYGIPGQSEADLEADLAEALELGPEHLSCYELEAKPGTRFTHAHGEELARQAEAMERYFERVVERLTGAGYRWYETANFCREPKDVSGRDLRARHNLAYWLGHDYLGVGIGAISTIGGIRRRNTPRLASYVEALGAGERPPRELEELPHDVQIRERVMLGLRLDEPLVLTGLEDAIDAAGLERLIDLGLARMCAHHAPPELSLSERGRFLGGAVTADLLA